MTKRAPRSRHYPRNVRIQEARGILHEQQVRLRDPHQRGAAQDRGAEPHAERHHPVHQL
jgi:hypothetical protein